jgi:hypothetical protein
MRSCLILLSALAIGGCAGISGPPPATTTTTRVQQADATHEYRSAPAPVQRAEHPRPTAAQAIRAFAAIYTNWNAQTVTAHLRVLAAVSIGQARSAMQLAAAGTAHDYELRRGGIANNGTVEAVAPLPGSRNQYVVVTRERTTATNSSAYQGLRPAWHVTIATVSRTAAGQWVLSGWEPQS